MHPLSGSDPATLWRLLRDNRPFDRAHLPALLAVAAVVLGRAPFTLLERATAGARLRRAPPPVPPVFIVGHWRSGTTHLYNIMSRDPSFGYLPPVATGLPWEMFTLGRGLGPLLRALLPRGRYIDNVAVRPDSPQEDEIALAAMQGVSYYHALYFPRRFRQNFFKGVFLDGATADDVARWQAAYRLLLGKLSVAQGGRRLLLKNPAHSARIPLLREMYPEARFIHITRDPVRVFSSMRNFYAKLLPRLALQPFGHVDVDDIILTTYARLMDRLLTDLAALPSGQAVELRFEDLERAPLPQLERIYRRLDLDGFAAARPAFAAYLESVRDYRKNVYRDAAESAALVRRYWGPYLRRWEQAGEGVR